MLAHLRHLRIRTKFIVLGIVALLMLAAPTAMLIQAEATEGERARLGQSALAPSARAMDALQWVVQHRDLSMMVAAGSLSHAEPRRAARETLDAAWGRCARPWSRSMRRRWQRASRN
jgi:hypothetical protein